MRYHNLLMCASSCLIAGLANVVSAQPGAGPGGRGADMMRMLPVMSALDADGNGEISADEIEQSVAALKGLDKNKDGKLTMDELRPEFAGPGGPGEGAGRGAGRPAGPLGAGPGGDAEGLVSRLMASDKNNDGKLAQDELEGRLQGIVARADTDNDGFATREELEKMAAATAERDARGPRGPGEGGPGRGAGFGGGFAGPPNPEAFVNRAFEFDADKDGKLSKEELGKMLSESGRPQGGRGQGGPRGDRPQRPQSE